MCTGRHLHSSNNMPAVAKNWDQIAKELSSGEDSDEHDELNVMSVQRNAHRVMDMMHTMLPGFEDHAKVAHERRSGYVPKGMNRAEPLKDGLAAAIDAASRHSRESHASREASSTGGGAVVAAAEAPAPSPTQPPTSPLSTVPPSSNPPSPIEGASPSSA